MACWRGYHHSARRLSRKFVFLQGLSGKRGKNSFKTMVIVRALRAPGWSGILKWSAFKSGNNRANGLKTLMMGMAILPPLRSGRAVTLTSQNMFTLVGAYAIETQKLSEQMLLHSI